MYTFIVQYLNFKSLLQKDEYHYPCSFIEFTFSFTHWVGKYYWVRWFYWLEMFQVFRQNRLKQRKSGGHWVQLFK